MQLVVASMIIAIMSFLLTGCTSADAEQQAVVEQPSRYEFVRDPSSTNFTGIYTVTDKETGQQWLVIFYGSHGIAMQPIGGAE